MPPPLPPAEPGLTGRAKLLIGGGAAGLVLFAVVLLTLPLDEGPAVVLPAVIAPPVAVTITPPAAPPIAPQPPPVVAPPPPAAAAAAAPAPAPTPTGTMIVSGAPRGSRLRVDGRTRTGSTIPMVAGRHILTMTAPGFADHTDTVRVRAGDTLRWSPTLVAAAAGTTPTTNARPKIDATPRAAVRDETECRNANTKQDWSAAVTACTRAALGGSIPAKRSLAGLYQDGRGTSRSDLLAARWYEEAGRGGDVEAMYQTATFYERGRGVKKDQATAVSWYTRAAEGGNAPSQYLLGEAYERGRLGVSRDKVKARDWFGRAAAQNYRDAADKVRALSR